MKHFAGLPVWGFALVFATTLLMAPVTAGGASLDQKGCAEPPKFSLPPLPKLSVPKVNPEDSSGPWTATFKFHSAGQASVTWGCLSEGMGIAENVGYAITVTGRYGHGSAEEVVTLAIGSPTGVAQKQPWMGSHTFTTYMQCPEGDPWLLGKSCKVTGTTTPIPGIHFKGPFPLTRGQVPADQRVQLLYQAFPPKFVQPTPMQQIPNGQPVKVVLAKSGPHAAQPVNLVFSHGEWTEQKSFNRSMTGGTLIVEGLAFTPGEWKIEAKYANDKSMTGVKRTFVMLGGWGGGPAGGGGGRTIQKPQPGAERRLKPVQPVPPPSPQLPPGSTRTR